MSFSLQAAGTVDQVRAQLAAQDAAQQQVKSAFSDTSQVDKVRVFILGELDSWPTSTDPTKRIGVFVEASGHHDTYTSRNVTLTMRPIWLAVDLFAASTESQE